MLPLVWLPKIWPFLATVPHINGNNTWRRSSGLSRQNLRFNADSSIQLPPFLGSRSNGSAPVNTSCQRSPSLTINTTVLVFCASAAGLRHRERARPNRQTANLRIEGFPDRLTCGAESDVQAAQRTTAKILIESSRQFARRLRWRGVVPTRSHQGCFVPIQNSEVTQAISCY